MDNKNNEAVDGVVASEEISLEEQQAVLEKFDQESNTRNVTGFAKGFIKWYAIAMAVFHVYTSFFGLWATIRQRAMHLLFVMPLCYLMYPAKKGGARNNPSLLDWVFAALSFVCCGYIVVNYDAIFLRGGLPKNGYHYGLSLRFTGVGSSPSSGGYAAADYCSHIPWLCLLWQIYARHSAAQRCLHRQNGRPYVYGA